MVLLIKTCLNNRKAKALVEQTSISTCLRLASSVESHDSLEAFLIRCGLVGLYEVISVEPVPKQLARAANPIVSESFESLKLQPLSTEF
jgi:hypothetical protein